jgi:hypothetical protein
MGLSRLDNFLKSARGEILYVDPSSIDSTDSIENKGNSLTRPFKTLQRALIEAARFSYQGGDRNDRFEKTTIMLYPGEHIIDNRPGWIPDGSNNFRLRDGTTSNLFTEFNLDTNFNINSPGNALYKLNSIHGGVIVPRGVSIVGVDLRKTKIKPRYVPDPENNNIERSAIFRLTGACFLNNFSIFDANPSGTAFKDYTTNLFVPNFSHHKLTVFEYADGTNPVVIDDEFQTYSTTRTDLDMYYEKVGLAYGQSSGREIFPDYPTNPIDIQAKIDESRIVGSLGVEVGITSIKAGDGSNTSNVITATLSAPIPDLSVDTAIQIQGIGPSGYNGQFIVSAVNGETELQYKVQNPPSNPKPTSLGGATASVVSDTVTSASPYVFSVSLRSVFGMCGMWADGDKATGFKSMVVAQFTGISLQKDPNAFVKYNSDTGTYEGKNAPGNSSLNTDSRAIYRPEYENWHVRASNNSFIQIVSVFAIGYAKHFYADSGGDFSITNSNSNFGNTSLFASGFRDDAFLRDDVGYITHIIPPKIPDTTEVTTEFGSIDVSITTGVGNSSRLYLYNETNENVIPPYIIDGYRIGAKRNDTINVNIPVAGITSTYSARIVIPNTQGTAGEATREKVIYVNRSGSSNDINTSTYVINLETTNTFINGEKIRVISDNGELPDGLTPNQVYYAITTSDDFTNSSQIKLAQTFNDALNDRAIKINDRGGVLRLVSRVSDKIPGEPGHPIIWDSSINQWYLNVSPTVNTIYNALVQLGTGYIGTATPRTFIVRRPDTRNLIDTIYRVRYVIPASSSITSRPPVEGFIVQESNSTTGSTQAEIQKYFSTLTVDLSNLSELRNFKFVADATWSSNVARIRTELPHNFSVGDSVELYNIKSTLNVDGSERLGFNGKFTVTSIVSRKEFTYALTTNPGTFTSDTSSRTTSLPRVSRRKLSGIYSIYKAEETQKYIKNEKDGIYHLTLVNASNAPSAEEFSDLKFSQPVQYLYPQSNRDEPIGDPEPSASSATSSLIGQVVINDPHTSLTRETLESNLRDFGVGIALTNIVSNAQGTVHTLYSKIDHGLNRAVSVSIVNSGSNYGTGIGVTQVLYNARLVSEGGPGSGQNATARVTVNGSGQITNVKIMDGGNSYGIGNTLAVVGIATTTNHFRGVVQVTAINNNVGDNVVLSGIRDKNYSQYNGVYRITAVSSLIPNTVEVVSVNPISSPATGGISSSVLSRSNLTLTGKSKLVSSLIYDNVSGIATVITSSAHGLRKDNRIILSGADNSLFNDSFVIDRVVGLSTFILHLPTSPTPVGTSGTIYTNIEGFNSRGGFISNDNENTDGRMISVFGNLTATLSSAVLDLTTDEIFISNLTDYDFNIGDFIIIDDEIMRISRQVPNTLGSPVKVFRGILGTKRNTHPNGSVVKRINVYPVEFRRNTIIRASGHTFEYVGYGPGNYSTAFPDKQDRQINDKEELLSISKKDSGGVIIFNGINSDGDYYIGNKKINSSTGQEEVFDTPVLSVTGEEIVESDSSVGFNVISPSEISVNRSIRVEGGSDKNIISEFGGPVIFNNKITSNSPKGIETHSIFLQGDARISRKYTVGISTPADSSNPGDITFKSDPTAGDNIGWVFTGKNHWYQFGYISVEKDANVQVFDKVGIGVTSPNNNLLQIGSATSSFYVNNSGNVAINTTPNPAYALNVNGVIFGDGSGLFNVSDIWEGDAVGVHTTTPVGVGTTSAKEGFGLYVEGSAAFNGSLRVYEIIEKATISTSILTTGSPVNIDLGDNNVYYFTNNATGNWGVNFRAGVGLALTSFLSKGESMTVAILTTQGATPYYNNVVRIDGVGITPKYYGGSVINSGNANSLDSYTYVVIRKDSTGNPSADFTILYSQSQYS